MKSKVGVSQRVPHVAVNDTMKRWWFCIYYLDSGRKKSLSSANEWIFCDWLFTSFRTLIRLFETIVPMVTDIGNCLRAIVHLINNMRSLCSCCPSSVLPLIASPPASVVGESSMAHSDSSWSRLLPPLVEGRAREDSLMMWLFTKVSSNWWIQRLGKDDTAKNII